MLAQDRCVWAQGWTENRSRSYGLKEAQVQAYLNKPGPDGGAMFGLGRRARIEEKVNALAATSCLVAVLPGHRYRGSIREI